MCFVTLGFLGGVSTLCREDFDGFRPCEHRVPKANYGSVESSLPNKGFIVCVYHREVSVEGVEGVADKGARFGGYDFSVSSIEYN